MLEDMKYAGREMVRHVFIFIWQLLVFIIGSSILSAALWVGTSYFYGTTSIICSVDGKPVKGAIVEIDGKYAGDTPFTIRLEPGAHSVAVLPPENVLTNEIEMDWNVIMFAEGQVLDAQFTEMTDEQLEEQMNSAAILIPGN